MFDRRLLSVWLVGLVLAVVASPRTSRAADSIDVVTLGPEGTDKQLPLGTEFYLAGDPGKDGKEVFVVVVRTSWAFLNLWSPAKNRCSELKNLGAPKDFGTDTLTNTDKLWPNTHATEPALVLGPWQRKSADDAQYKVLIPTSSLFRPGASYCLLSYVKKSVTESLVIDFKKRLLELKEKILTCSTMTGQPQIDCENQGIEALAKALTKDFDGADPENVRAAWDAVRKDLQQALRDFALTGPHITNITGSWPVLYPHDPAGSLIPVPPPAPPPADKSKEKPGKPDKNQAAPPPEPESFGLGFVLAELLGAKGELVRLEPGYRFNGGTVKRIAVASDFTFLVEVEQPVTAGAAATVSLQALRVPAADVLLPDSKLSVEDAWQLANGFIKINGEYREIRKLNQGPLKALEPASSTEPFTAAQLDDLTAVATAFVTWKALFKKQTLVEKNVNDKSNAARIFRALGKTGDAASQKQLRDAVSTVSDLLDQYVNSERSWNDAPNVIRSKTTVSLEGVGSAEVDSKAGLTQERWFDTYFTPVVGRAMVFGRSATFGQWYAGVQLYFYANSVNEPMWSNGFDDFRRSIGFEFAALTTTGNFGPNNRFSTDSDVGLAWMFGPVIQPLPYTTFSAGGVWVSERESRVAAEQPHAHLSLYVGLAVQANVPGIIRTIATPSKASPDGAKSP
jgi:hypothetical protein